eukprot:260785_1
MASRSMSLLAKQVELTEIAENTKTNQSVPFTAQAISISDENDEIHRNTTSEYVQKAIKSNYRCIGWLLHIGMLLLTIFFAALSCIYGIGQLYLLQLSDFWCDPNTNYTLPEIRQYNRLHNNEYGDELSCYQTHAIVDFYKLFSIDTTASYSSKLDINTKNTIFCVIYIIVAFLYTILSIVDIIRCIKNCIKPPDPNKKKNEKKKQSDLNANQHNTAAEQDMEDSKISKTKFVINKCKYLKDLYQASMSMDTSVWVMKKIFSECFEIFIQTTVLFNYGGTSISSALFNDTKNDKLILSEIPFIIKLFAAIIMCNGIFAGISWLLYSLFPRKIFGYQFSYALFIIDSLFEFCNKLSFASFSFDLSSEAFLVLFFCRNLFC